MISIIALVLQVLMGLITPQQGDVTVIPPMPQTAPEFGEVTEWNLYYREAEAEYADEFTALFNSYETKRAKNGALMIRRGNKGSYRFAKKG